MGILRSTTEGLFVDFCEALWNRFYREEEIREYLAKQGYAEAEKLPYQVTKEGLIVMWQPKAESAGWLRAINVDGIPF